MKKPIVIYTYDFDMGIGGIKVMHKLCHMLNELGYESYLMPIHIADTFQIYYDNTPLITHEILHDIENCIVIYPEGIRYNPLNSKNVVRWILGPPDNDVISTWDKSDMILWYMDYYYNESVGQRDSQMFVTEAHSNIFYNHNAKRNGSSYCVRKCKDPKFIHPDDSIFIPYHAAGNLVELAKHFNQVEKFYCYDNYTFLYVQAALCGCISIVVPDGSKTKQEWINGSRLNQYGIAFGEDDIDRARETLPLLMQEIKQFDLDTEQQIHIFINKCKELFR
jgi:hypothetical protein